MNILFLIGNGFDLNLGLKTDYASVLKAYLEENKNKTDEKLSKFLSALQSREYDELSRKLKSELWSDFEKGIGNLSAKYELDEVEDYRYSIKHFKQFIINHLKKEDDCIFPMTEPKRSDFNKLITEHIFGFFRHLKADSIEHNIEAKLSASPNTYNIINFNYTSTFERCVNGVEAYMRDMKWKKKFKIGQYRHIHGTLDNNFIMGVDNSFQIENVGFRGKVREFIKPEINESISNFSRESDRKLIEDSDIICIFGMSFGETDKTWWKIIGQWFLNRGKKNETKKEKFLIHFAKEYIENGEEKVEYITGEDTKEDVEIKNTYKEKFYNVAEISVNKKDIDNSFHIVINSDIFNVKRFLDIKPKEKASIQTAEL